MHTLCGEPMLIVRPLTIIENRVHRGQIGLLRIEPPVEVLGLDRNDATIVTGCGNLRRRFVGDGRE